MRQRRIAPWLLTLGLVVTVFAWTWQHLEESGRSMGGEVLVPTGFPMEPRETLVERIHASWEPGDRLRAVLLAAGLALVAAGAWRAWRVEGLSVRVVRRIALTLGTVGASCVLLALLRARTHPREPGSWLYVPDSAGGRDIGHALACGDEAPAGLLPLSMVGGALLALALLIGLLSLLLAPRAPRPSREPASTP